MKIMLDAGHGPNTRGKRSPDGMIEFEFNQSVATIMGEQLKEYEGVIVYNAHDSNRDVPLVERTARANRLNVDLYFSIHANAFRGTFGNHSGIETYVYLSKPQEAFALAKEIQKELINATKLRNRGVKTADFHVLRETKMTALLVEHGFMDSRIDLPKLKSSSFRKLCAKTNVRTIAKFYNLTKRTNNSPENSSSLYKVQVGAFKNKENALMLAEKLQQIGFEAIIIK